MINKSPLGTLCRLPLEVREIVYSYLTPPSRLPTVLRSRHVGVSSVSHRPPPIDLLLTCSQLYAEALDVYYRKCVFKFDGLLDPANVWPLWQIEEVLGNSELGLVTLANMRKIELNLFWHRLPEGGIANIALADMAGNYGYMCKSEVDKRVERLGRAVQVLKRAERLGSVILTWKEVPARVGEEQPDWVLKEKVLQSLGALRGPTVVAGDVVASAGVEASLLGFIAEVNKPRCRLKEGMVHRRMQAAPHRDYLDLVEVQQTHPTIGGELNKDNSYFA